MVGIIVVVLLGSFFTRIFIHKHVDSELDRSVEPETPTEGIQINILNSTSISGIADIARNYMRARGFDVVEIGNYSALQKRSMGLGRVGDFSSALKVAQGFGRACS